MTKIWILITSWVSSFQTQRQYPRYGCIVWAGTLKKVW